MAKKKEEQSVVQPTSNTQSVQTSNTPAQRATQKLPSVSTPKVSNTEEEEKAYLPPVIGGGEMNDEYQVQTALESKVNQPKKPSFYGYGRQKSQAHNQMQRIRQQGFKPIDPKELPETIEKYTKAVEKREKYIADVNKWRKERDEAKRLGKPIPEFPYAKEETPTPNTQTAQQTTTAVETPAKVTTQPKETPKVEVQPKNAPKVEVQPKETTTKAEPTTKVEPATKATEVKTPVRNGVKIEPVTINDALSTQAALRKPDEGIFIPSLGRNVTPNVTPKKTTEKAQEKAKVERMPKIEPVTELKNVLAQQNAPSGINNPLEAILKAPKTYTAEDREKAKIDPVTMNNMLTAQEALKKSDEGIYVPGLGKRVAAQQGDIVVPVEDLSNERDEAVSKDTKVGQKNVGVGSRKDANNDVEDGTEWRDGDEEPAPQSVTNDVNGTDKTKVNTTTNTTSTESTNGESAAMQKLSQTEKDALKTYNELVQDLIEKRKEAEKEDETRSRREANMQMISSIVDGLSGLANLIGVSKGASNVNLSSANALLGPKFEEAQKQRKADIKDIDTRLEQKMKELNDMRVKFGLAQATQLDSEAKEAGVNKRHKESLEQDTKKHEEKMALEWETLRLNDEYRNKTLAETMRHNKKMEKNAAAQVGIQSQRLKYEMSKDQVGLTCGSTTITVPRTNINNQTVGAIYGLVEQDVKDAFFKKSYDMYGNETGKTPTLEEMLAVIGMASQGTSANAISIQNALKKLQANGGTTNNGGTKSVEWQQ